MTLNVLYCSDDNYAPYLGVSVCSILENNKQAESIVFYVVSDGISDKNIEKLKRQINKYGEGRRLVLIDGKAWVERLISMNIMPYRGGQTANLRLFFMEYIEKDVSRLLYLDCDTIICGDISPLFQTDMKDCAVAVVLDSLSDAEYKSIIGFAPSDEYFNSGVVLFDVNNWSAHGCTEILAGHMKNSIYHLPNPDQDFLNILLKDDKLILSPKYNFQTTHGVYSNRQYFVSYAKSAYYTADEIAEAYSDPVILHAYRFLGQFPWHENAVHPWRKIWWDFVKISEWNDLKPKANGEAMFKVERVIYRIVPKAIFLPLFKKWQTYTFTKKVKDMQKAKEKNK